MSQSSPDGAPTSGVNITEFGYAQELKRGTGRFASFAVAFAFVSIATGIFTTYGSVLATSGAAAIWTWPLVVFGQLMVALIYGSLAARIPVTGYSYQWISRLANPVLGWVMGWISFTFLVVVVVAVDYTIASAVFPGLFGYTETAANTWFVTSAFLLVQALLVAVSMKWTQRVNTVAVVLELLGIALLIVLLFVVGAIAKELDFSNLFSTGPNPAESYFSFGSLTHAGPWVMGTLLGAFTIVGFESAANLAEETKQPARVVPRAMRQAILASGALGFLFLIAITMAGGDLAKLAQSDTPLPDVINRVLGPAVGFILLLLVTISIFACGMVVQLTGTRLVWAMSRDERFPGHRSFHRISPRLGTPVGATVLVFLVAQAILAIFSFQADVLFSLFAAGTLLPAILYAITVLVYIIKRRKLPRTKGFALGRWEVPVLVLASAWLIFELTLFRDASFASAWVYILIMVAIGAVYLMFLLVRRGGSSGLKMPSMESIDKELDADALHARDNDKEPDLLP